MPPRRRTSRPRVGLLRMDAALDFFAEMGFAKSLVRKTINDLLKTYGGDGWPFIEEACYKVVLDVLLEEKNHSEIASVSDANEDDDKAVAVAENDWDNDVMDSYPALEDSLLVQANSYLEALNAVPQIDDKNMDDKENEPKKLRGGNLVGASTNDDDLTIGALIIKKRSADVDADLDNTEPASQVLNTRKRKPCYGWLSDDEDEDEDIKPKTRQLVRLVFPPSPK